MTSAATKNIIATDIIARKAKKCSAKHLVQARQNATTVLEMSYFKRFRSNTRTEVNSEAYADNPSENRPPKTARTSSQQVRGAAGAAQDLHVQWPPAWTNRNTTSSNIPYFPIPMGWVPVEVGAQTIFGVRMPQFALVPLQNYATFQQQSAQAEDRPEPKTPRPGEKRGKSEKKKICNLCHQRKLGTHSSVGCPIVCNDCALPPHECSCPNGARLVKRKLPFTSGETAKIS